MRRHSPSPLDPLGVEAGRYEPARTLGDAVAPPPRGLRRVVATLLIVMILGATAAVYLVPPVSQGWDVVMRQTDRALGRILGRAEHQTTEVLRGIATESSAR